MDLHSLFLIKEGCACLIGMKFSVMLSIYMVRDYTAGLFPFTGFGTGIFDCRPDTPDRERW